MEAVELTRRERGARWAVSAAITVLVFAQAPGRIVAETKLDVLLDPFDYLGRALTAWDPSGGFGRVQNQAVGYLFPMGAFTSLGHVLDIPPWIVQRAWIALILVVSFWGAHRVARAVGVGSDAGRIVAATAYALAPATLSLAAFQSAGQLPYALAPWVLVPLLEARPGASPRRVAAWSALWVAAMGGVNGASAFAVLPLVLVWFTTRAPGPERRRLLGWWIAGVAAATAWWLIPLLVSVRYGIRFTDFTESSSLTTWTESGTEILRGTGNWLSYIDTDAGRWLPGSWALAADRVAIVGSVGLAAAGLWGLARRDAPGRSWLGPAFVLGAIATGIGYAGAWGGPLSGIVQDLLDGPLAPFRNVHKFAAVVRLPLAIGLGHAVAVAAQRLAAARDASSTAASRHRLRPLAAPALAVILIGLAIAPAADQLTAPGSFDDVPPAWREAGAWLEAHDDGDRTLLLPGAAFGEFQWGRPLDEPISSIQDTNWATRDLIPLGGNGSTRILDAIDTALASDALPPGFLAALQRSGTRYLLVRNDLDLDRTFGPGPASVRRLLATEPELELVASFGPVQQDVAADQRLAAVPGASGAEVFRTLDLYEVPDPTPRAVAYPAADAAVTSGGPEAVVQLDPSITDGRAVVLSVDEGADDLPDPLLVATDTARRRDVRFGAIRNNVTYTLTPEERSPATGDAPVDRWPADEPRGLTSARLDGAASLTASHHPGQPLRPWQQPFAAFDGDPATAWGPADAQVGEWLQLDLDQPTDGPVTIRIPATEGKRIGRVRVVADGGSEVATIGKDGTVTVDVPGGSTRSLRFVIDDIVGTAEVERVGISEIEIPGLHIERPLVVPSPSPEGAEVVSVARDHVDRFSLTRRDEQATLDREFRWTGSESASLHGTASAAPGAALDALLASAVGDGDDEGAIEASATSQFGGQPAFAPSAAVDGDPQTAWVSAPQAGAPALTLSWDRPLPIDVIEVAGLAGVGEPIGRVVVTAGGSSFERTVEGGQVTIPSTITDEVTLSFPGGDGDGAHQAAVAEVTIPALLGRTAAAADRSTEIDLPCGEGPPVAVDGEAVPTRATTTVGALLDGTAVAWEACEPVALDAGEHRLEATAGSLVVSTLEVLPADGIAPAPEARTVEVGRWDASSRSVTVGAGDAAILATTENLNDGWEATLDGEVLTPIRVDGWRQGWRVPEGVGGTVVLRYRPATAQRIGLAIGAVALLALVAAAIVRPRRGRGGEARTWAPAGDRPWSTPVLWALPIGAGVALGGVVGLVALPLGWLAVRGRARWLPALAAAAAVAAGAVTFAWPGAEVGDHTGTFSGPAQALATIAVVAMAAALLDRSTEDGADPAVGSAGEPTVGSAEPLGS